MGINKDTHNNNQEIYLCVPVLNRYDLLHRLLVSITYSSAKPDHLFIIDNGRNPSVLHKVMASSKICDYKIDISTLTPVSNLGVAASWNRFISDTYRNSKRGILLLVNDDITLAPYSIQSFKNTITSKARPTPQLVFSEHGFSFFYISKECVKSVGLFDETISPEFGYFEDLDYIQRIQQYNSVQSRYYTRIHMCDIVTRSVHIPSSTIAMLGSKSELDTYHVRLNYYLAQSRYIQKYGKLPDTLVAIPEPIKP